MPIQGKTGNQSVIYSYKRLPFSNEKLWASNKHSDTMKPGINEYVLSKVQKQVKPMYDKKVIASLMKGIA